MKVVVSLWFFVSLLFSGDGITAESAPIASPSGVVSPSVGGPGAIPSPLPRPVIAQPGHVEALPTARFALKTMFKRRAGLKDLRLVTQVTFKELGEEGSSVEKWRHTWTYQAGLLRLKATEPVSGKLLYAVEWGPSSQPPVWIQLLFPRDEGSLNQSLASAGMMVEESRSRLVRLVGDTDFPERPERKIIWSYGVGPTLGFERESFFPVSWSLAKDESDSEVREWRWGDYVKLKDFAYPKKWMTHVKTGDESFEIREEVLEAAATISAMERKTFNTQAPETEAAGARKVYQLF